MSYLFNAAGETITVAAGISIPSTFSMCAWIKPNSSTGRDWVFGGDDTTLHITPGGSTASIRLDVGFSSSLGRWRGADDIINLTGVWQGIACSMDATSDTNDPLLYYLANESATIAADSVSESIAPSGSFVNTTTDWWAGGFFSAYAFDGRLAHIQIFSGIKSSADLESALKVPGSITSGLLLHWPMQSNANDTSGNSRNGTVNSATLDGDHPALGGGGGSPSKLYYRSIYGMAS